MNSVADSSGALLPDLMITRLLDAPRDLVWTVWTDPAHVAAWWGPRDFTSAVHQYEPYPGGVFRISMFWPDGTEIPTSGEFRDVVQPERLAFVSTAFEDADGVPQLEVLTTITFAEESGRTRLTLTAVVLKGTPEVAESLAGMEEGWNQSLDKFVREVADTRGERP